MIIDILKMILIQVKKRKMRTFLTMLQVMLGITTIVLIFTIVFSLWDGIREMEESFADSVYNFRVIDQSQSTGRQSYAVPQNVITAQDVKDLKNNINTIEYISPLNRSSDILLNYNEQYFRINSKAFVSPEFLQLTELSLERGMFFTESDYQQSSQVAVISRSAANQIFSGGQNPIGKDIVVYRNWRFDDQPQEVTYNIIGVFDPGTVQDIYSQLLGNQLLIPATVQSGRIGSSITYSTGTKAVTEIGEKMESVNSGIRYSSVFIRIDRGQYTSTLAALNAFVKDKYGGNMQAQLTAEEGMVGGFSEAMTYLSMVMGGFGFLILIIGSIGILSTMMVNILERTRQIGIEKALGASRRLIFFKFNLESIMIALGGGIMGIILAYFLSDYILILLEALPINIQSGLHPLAILLGILVSIFTGWIFGIYPSIQASGLGSTEALRDNN